MRAIPGKGFGVSRIREEVGANLLETALALLLISLVALAAISYFGQNTTALWDEVPASFEVGSGADDADADDAGSSGSGTNGSGNNTNNNNTPVARQAATLHPATPPPQRPPCPDQDVTDLRDTLGIRALTFRQRALLNEHNARASAIFVAMLADDPNGLTLAERPLSELPAADSLARASSDELISTVIASAGYLRKIPLSDGFRSISLREPRSYRRHFAAIRVLELAAQAGFRFDLEATKLLCAIALNAALVEGVTDVAIRRGPTWPDFAARMITSRIVTPERLDLFDVAISAAESLDGGLYDGALASQVVRTGERLQNVDNPTYEVGEMYGRVQRVLQKPTSLLRVALP